MHVLWAHTEARSHPFRPRFGSSSPELSGAVWSAVEMQLIMKHTPLIDGPPPLQLEWRCVAPPIIITVKALHRDFMDYTKKRSYLGINSFGELRCFVQNLCRRQPSSLQLQGSGLMRLNVSRPATYSSEHSSVNIWGRMDCGRISRGTLGCYLTGRKQTQSPLCRVFRQMPIRSGVLSLSFHVCKKCCLIAALIWKQSNTSEEKSPLNKARRRIDTVRWCCWLRRCDSKEERCTSAAFSVSIIPDAQLYLDISTSGSLGVRIICRDGNRCVSLQSSMHGFICLLMDWRTYLHIIRLPLHREEETLALVPTVKWSVPDQLLLSMSSEP